MDLETINRRTFVKNTALAASSLILPSALWAATNPKKDKLGIALVGLGYYSTDLLAPALQLTKNCYLAGIVTGTPAKAETWKKKYNIPDKNIYDYKNFDQIANNPDIDVVYVVLPPSMHREFVVRAAKAGKQVWCEKPMAPTVADCQAMIKACADYKVNLAIGYRCQHDPNTQAYQKFAKEQTFGKIRMISCGAGYVDGRTTHWKQNKALGGGVMGDMGVYAIQGARLAAGEEPVAVSGRFHTTRPDIYKEVEETAMMHLEFPSGAVAACHTSFGIQMNYLKVNCEKGWYNVEPFSSYSGNKGESKAGIINFPLENQQARQMDDDAAAIMKKTMLLTPGEEGLRDIRIVEAIKKSAADGGRIVKL